MIVEPSDKVKKDVAELNSLYEDCVATIRKIQKIVSYHEMVVSRHNTVISWHDTIVSRHATDNYIMFQTLVSRM